uniref:zinc finger C2HC domain-containing protein 1C isoform X2 n=1 Tax=Jaculus jaculus TaxID=51337 RepID=UPI001E1B50E0|nr:zinc finger C2HC domain-containing protein 1C isoform X2 [Jaculus jaculus]
MAGLQLAPHLPVGIMFPHNKTEAPGLHSTKQDPYEQGDSSQRSSAGHLRNTFQQKVLNSREVELDDVCAQPKWNTYPHSAEISQQAPGRNPQGQGKGLFYPSSPQSRYPKANDQDFIPFAKKRIGVDRAYPLKPMVHRKSRSMGEAGTDGDQNVYPRSPQPRELPDSNFGLRSWANSSVLAAMQVEKAMADLHRMERTQIQRLEAAGESLQREIRRKEILLREKLKKTEAGLRRIQREKEQAKENEDRGLQRMVLARRVKGGSSYKEHLAAEARVFHPDPPSGPADTAGHCQRRKPLRLASHSACGKPRLCSVPSL